MSRLLENTRLYSKTEYKRNKKEGVVVKQQFILFVANDIVIPKELVGGANTNV